jgi:membrane-associated protease RseP (regulator of RpoE activity)
VQEQVHAGDGRGGEILLLAEELAPQALYVTVLFLHVLDSGEQHAAGTAGRVVDGLAFAWVEHLDHQAHHAARGIELAGLLVGGVGEFLDQVFVGIADQVRLDVLITKGQPREMLDQIFEQGIGQSILVGPLGIAKNAVERVGVGLLDLAHGAL